MGAYTKEFLVSAYLSRFISIDLDIFERLEKMADEFYDKVGRDKFRTYTGLDADALRLYKNSGL